MKTSFVVILFFSIFHLHSQNFEKVRFNEGSDGYYLAVLPETDDIQGVLVLLPGFGQKAESIFPESKLQNVAYVNGILTIAVAGGRKLYADDGVINKLNEAIRHVISRYDVDKEKFIVGGFSAGGTVSLRYTEHCNANPDMVPVIPKAVFSVDSPVDLFAIWDYFQREIGRNYSEVGVGEAKFVSEIMLSEIGDPITESEHYNRLTPFNADLDEPGNEKHLKDTAVRVYEDIDVVWQLKNRRRSLYDSNALGASEMINRLLLMGNKKAEFMTAKQPGYRSNGTRHPHSWSIIDEVEFVQWALKIYRGS